MISLTRNDDVAWAVCKEEYEWVAPYAPQEIQCTNGPMIADQIKLTKGEGGMMYLNEVKVFGVTPKGSFH